MKRFLVPALIGAFAIFYWYRYVRTPEIDFGKIQLSDETKTTFSLADSIQFPAVIHFYASWCGPCMAELPAIKHAQNTLENIGYHFYFISDDSFEMMRTVKSKFGLGGSHYRTESLSDIGIRSLPGTHIAGKSGTTVFKTTGACNWQDNEFIKSLRNFANK